MVLQVLYAKRNDVSITNDTEYTHLTNDLKVKPEKIIKKTTFEKFNSFSDNENTKCKYYTNQQFKENNSDKYKNQITILHLNMSSLTYHNDKFTELLSYIKTNFKIVGIMESRLATKKDPISTIDIPSHNIKHTPTKLDKGAPLFYIFNELNHKKRNNRKIIQG